MNLLTYSLLVSKIISLFNTIFPILLKWSSLQFTPQFFYRTGPRVCFLSLMEKTTRLSTKCLKSSFFLYSGKEGRQFVFKRSALQEIKMKVRLGLIFIKKIQSLLEP